MVSYCSPEKERVNTHAELDRNGEEVAARLLGNLGTTRDTREVDVAGLGEALGTRNGLQQLLGESLHFVSPNTLLVGTV